MIERPELPLWDGPANDGPSLVAPNAPSGKPGRGRAEAIRQIYDVPLRVWMRLHQIPHPLVVVRVPWWSARNGHITPFPQLRLSDFS